MFLLCLRCALTGHHTVYIGVHVPKSYHRRRRHRRKSNHKERRERVEQVVEGYKSDVDDSSSSFLKPLSEYFPNGLWELLKALCVKSTTHNSDGSHFVIYSGGVWIHFSLSLQIFSSVSALTEAQQSSWSMGKGNGKTGQTNLKMTPDWPNVCKVNTKRGIPLHLGA